MATIQDVEHLARELAPHIEYERPKPYMRVIIRDRVRKDGDSFLLSQEGIDNAYNYLLEIQRRVELRERISPEQIQSWQYVLPTMRFPPLIMLFLLLVMCALVCAFLLSVLHRI